MPIIGLDSNGFLKTIMAEFEFRVVGSLAFFFSFFGSYRTDYFRTFKDEYHNTSCIRVAISLSHLNVRVDLYTMSLLGLVRFHKKNNYYDSTEPDYRRGIIVNSGRDELLAPNYFRSS